MCEGVWDTRRRGGGGPRCSEPAPRPANTGDQYRLGTYHVTGTSQSASYRCCPSGPHGKAGSTTSCTRACGGREVLWGLHPTRGAPLLRAAAPSPARAGRHQSPRPHRGHCSADFSCSRWGPGEGAEQGATPQLATGQETGWGAVFATCMTPYPQEGTFCYSLSGSFGSLHRGMEKLDLGV